MNLFSQGLGVAAVLAVCAPTSLAQCELDQINSATAFAPDGFGSQVMVSEQRAAASCLFQGQVAIQVFQRFGMSWHAIDMLTARVGTDFGEAMDMEGDTLVVGMASTTAGSGDGLYGAGDPNGPASSGEVDVYDLTVPGGLHVQTIVPSDAELGAVFGHSVAVDGNTMVVGAPGDDELSFNAGAAYVFEKIDGVWVEVAKLYSDNPSFAKRFGGEVDIDGDTIIVTPLPQPFFIAPASFGPQLFEQDQHEDRIAHVFERRGASWERVAKLRNRWENQLDGFGREVAVSGDTIMVAAMKKNPKRGRVLVYENLRTGWTYTHSLQPTTIPADTTADVFGSDLDIEGDVAMIASPHSTGANDGFAYVFKRRDGWHQVSRIAGSGAGPDGFGVDVAVAPEFAIVGAAQTIVNATFDGTAYLYGVGADCSGNGVADVCDLSSGSLSDIDGDMIPDDCD